MLPGIMLQHWNEIDFSESVDDIETVRIFLYEKYQSTYNRNQIKKLMKKTKKKVRKMNDAKKLARAHIEYEDMEFDMEVERIEATMIAKNQNKHVLFHGYLDDWDPLTHGLQYDGECHICEEYIQEDEEFLELECTHIEHTKCIELTMVNNTHSCAECNTPVRVRPGVV